MGLDECYTTTNTLVQYGFHNSHHKFIKEQNGDKKMGYEPDSNGCGGTGVPLPCLQTKVMNEILNCYYYHEAESLEAGK